jgi:hypothetical protein
LISDMQ